MKKTIDPKNAVCSINCEVQPEGSWSDSWPAGQRGTAAQREISVKPDSACFNTYNGMKNAKIMEY